MVARKSLSFVANVCLLRKGHDSPLPGAEQLLEQRGDDDDGSTQ
jgi:hypothetical protein